MFFSQEYYKLMFESYKDDKNKFSLILYFYILDELYLHNIKTKSDSQHFFNLLFNFCEDYLIVKLFEIKSINKLFFKEYEANSRYASSNYVILNFLFKNFGLLFAENIKIDFEQLPIKAKSLLERYVESYVKRDFNGSLFFN